MIIILSDRFINKLIDNEAIKRKIFHIGPIIIIPLIK